MGNTCYPRKTGKKKKKKQSFVLLCAKDAVPKHPKSWGDLRQPGTRVCTAKSPQWPLASAWQVLEEKPELSP